VTNLLPLSLILLAAFEFASVWFIMPLPGSQRIRSVEIAYALHSARWVVRGLLLIGLGVGCARIGRWRGWHRGALTPLVASQEFWHSWWTFHPLTTRYP
jgi:hypothetical protein